MMRLLTFLLSAAFSLPTFASAALPPQGPRLFAQTAYALSEQADRSLLRQDAGNEAAGFRVAEAQARQEQWTGAEAAYEAYLAQHLAGPEATEASLGLARARLHLGDDRGAAQAAEGAVASASSGDDAAEGLLLKAESLYQSDKLQEADAAYASIPAQVPGYHDLAYIAYARGWCWLRLSQLPTRGEVAADAESNSLNALHKAASFYAAAVTADPQGRLAPTSLYQQAECFYAAGDFAAAAKVYQAFEKQYDKHPLVPAARYSLAWCYFEEGQWKDAATAFHRFSVVHEDHPLAAWALYLAGVSLARGADYDLAQSAYELCLRQFPNSEVADRAQYGLAWLATARKDYVDAADEWQRFEKDYPQSSLAASATFLYADALYQQGRFAGAREQYLRLLKDHGQDPLAEDALYYAANTSLALGEASEARDEFQQFLRLRPDSGYAFDARRRLADTFYALGQLDTAESAYKDLRASEAPAGMKAADAAEVKAAAMLGLGWVSFSRQDWKTASQQFILAAKTSQGGAQATEAWLRAGDSLFNQGAMPESLDAYRNAAHLAPDDDRSSQAHFGAAWAAYRMKDFGQAFGEWGNARDLARDPSSKGEAAYWMAWALFRQNRFSDAAAQASEVPRLYPNTHLVPDALVLQGDSLQNAGQYDAAIAVYKQVSDGFPAHPKAAAALYGIQLCYTALGKDDEAVATSKAYLQLHKDSEIAPEVQYQVAEHYIDKKDFKKAEEEFDTLKTNYPKSKVDLTATYWRGQARFKNLKFNEAIQDWKDLVARDPQNALAPRALFKVGLAWYRMQEYPQAESTFKQVLDSYANTLDVAADARFNLGLTYKRMGRDSDAVQAYEAVWKDYPATELANMARMRIGYIYEDASDYPRAVESYRALAAADTGKLGAEAQYLVGDCLLAQKQSGEALLAYDAVAANFPAESGWVVTAQAKSGEVLEALGRDKEALERYQKIVAQGGDPTWVASAKKRIELLRQRLGSAAPAEAPAPKKTAKKAGKPKAEAQP
jgi:tol-pal system protein YbgF